MGKRCFPFTEIPFFSLYPSRKSRCAWKDPPYEGFWGSPIQQSLGRCDPCDTSCYSTLVERGCNFRSSLGGCKMGNLQPSRCAVEPFERPSSQMSHIDGMSHTALRLDSFRTRKCPCDRGSSRKHGSFIIGLIADACRRP